MYLLRQKLSHWIKKMYLRARQISYWKKDKYWVISDKIPSKAKIVRDKEDHYKRIAYNRDMKSRDQKWT